MVRWPDLTRQNTRFRCNQSSKMQHRLSHSFATSMPSPGGLWSLWPALQLLAGYFSGSSFSRNLSTRPAGHPFALKFTQILPTAQAIGLSGALAQSGMANYSASRFCLSDWLWPFIRGRDGPDLIRYPLRR